MKRIAFFVEGNTELLFVERLVREVAARNQVRVECRRLEGRPDAPIIEILRTDKDDGQQRYALIYDCTSDTTVLERVYQSVGMSYNKKQKTIERTNNSLDFSNIYLNVSNNFSDLKILCDAIDEFLT